MADQQSIGAKGLTLIKSFEGLQLNAYKCPAGIWTVGYGHTYGVAPGMRVTADEAEMFLRSDLESVCQTVRDAVQTPLTDPQFDAVVSFVFNVGATAFRKSTMLRFLNAARYRDAAEEFPRWNRAGGKVLPGLMRRRAAERELFLSGTA